MKRLLALLLTLVLVMSLFVACDSGKKKKDKDDDNTTEASGATQVVTDNADVVKPIEDEDDNTGNAVTKPLPDASEDEEGLDGTWVAEISLADLTGDSSMPEGVVEFKLEIDGDDVEMSADKNSLKKALSTMVEATCEASGITEDDFYAAMGVSEDEFMEQSLQEFSQSGSIDDFNISMIDDDTIDVDGIEFERD